MQMDLRIPPSKVFFSFKPAQYFFHHFWNTMLYFRINQEIIKVNMTLLAWLSSFHLSLWVCSMLCSKNFTTENIAKVPFSLLCRFLSRRILRLISGNTKELFKARNPSLHKKWRNPFLKTWFFVQCLFL